MKQRYQGGMSIVAWLAVLFIVVAVATCAIKMVPAYVENQYVVDALQSLAKNESNLKSLDKAQIRSHLSKYLIVNSVSDVASKSFEVRRYKRRLLVNSNYEVRAPIFMNVDVVMSFRSQLDTENPDLCCKYLIENFDEQN